MIATMNDTNLRLIRAIRRRWPNPDERAAALDISRRQLQRWELDDDIPQIVIRLIDLGIVTIADDRPTTADPIAA
jgi:hypothetical protein